MISTKIEKYLENWKLPPCSASHVFKRKGIFNFSADPTVRTVEKEIPLSEGYTSIPLFNDIPQRVDPKEFLDLQVGIVQVGLKPTKLGSNTSAIICLRDKTLLKFDQSVLGMVESSLSDGPIYFSYVPSHGVLLSDPYLSSTFVIDIKIQGSSTMQAGDGNVILVCRFHYKVVKDGTADTKKLSRIDAGGETTLFLTDVARSNLVVSKKIYWNQISVPQKWTVGNNDSASSAAVEEGEVGDARIDWREAAEEHVLKVDVPGFKKEEVKVEVEDGKILQIRGERGKEEEEEENDTWHRVERSSGRFLRRLTLPENAKMVGVKAAVENGVLTVRVPKVKEEVNKKPQVKVIDISG